MADAVIGVAIGSLILEQFVVLGERLLRFSGKILHSRQE
jgi:hypothetical protein